MKRSTVDHRRRAISTGIMLALAGSSLPTWAALAPGKFRIGYQKAASTLVLLRAHGTLEKQLAPLGIKVEWNEFAAGPQLLEGLNVGAIDFGYVGEAPPVFAQAANADFVYTAYEIPTPHAEGVLVPKDSPIRSVHDLKGKKVAFNKASDVHWFLVALLRKNGLDYPDIQPVFLAPADARAAFESKAVDAWAIWEPFLSAAEKSGSARLLADASGVASHHQFFLSARDYAKARPDVLNITLEALRAEGRALIADYPKGAAELAPIQGLPADVIEAGLRHYAHIYKPIDAAVIAEQQTIADTFFSLGLIPKKIVVKDAVLAAK
ncbi:MAG: sulfonate ABC transporter substrate-binding protein [Janthinobacterium lividum]